MNRHQTSFILLVPIWFKDLSLLLINFICLVIEECILASPFVAVSKRGDLFQLCFLFQNKILLANAILISSNISSHIIIASYL